MNKLVYISDSYNRSTHLELDFQDVTRLKKIFISQKFEVNLQDILNSILESNSCHRVKVLSGSPGLGKSTFALLVAQLISKNNSAIIKKLLSQSSSPLTNSFNQFQKSKNTKLLPVFLNGYEGEIEKNFTQKLQIALNTIGITTHLKSHNTINNYKKALTLIAPKGFSGIYVIYDEFGKYLEKGIHHPTELNIQFLQNFAEFCDRSGNKQCHLMLITHLSISQYAYKLPINTQQEWAKIEGRFQQSSFYDQNTDYYTIISSVFKKNISSTAPAMARKYKIFIETYIKGFKADAFDGFINSKSIKDILLNCFPLHPVVISLLPLLSSQIAQNERTLYTFLTRDENHSVKKFLENNSQDINNLLLPYSLYKYFSPLIKNDLGIGGTYKIQLIAEEALKQIDKKDDVSKQLISLMALCLVIKDAAFAPLTKEFIISCFQPIYSEKQIKASIYTLQKKGLIFYNKNSNQYFLQEGSPIDISEEISQLKNTTLTSKDLVQILKRYFKTDFIIPKKYNFDNSIIRFYKTEIISVDELRTIKNQKNINFYKEDGVVYYVVPFNHDELTYAKSFIKNLKQPLLTFILPTHFIESKKDIEELNAVNYLYDKKEIILASSMVRKELNRHRDILLSAIYSIFKHLIGYSKLKVQIYYPQDNLIKSISHFKQAQRFLGNIFEKEYSQYFAFNLEYINKHRVSGSITLGRKRFINLIKDKKVNSDNVDLYITGSGPDHAIFNTLQKISKFNYNKDNNNYQICSQSNYYKFLKEYENILSHNTQGINAQKLLDILISPPFGLRLGTIPLLIALADLCLNQPVSHYFDEAYVKELDGNHYDLLMKFPKKTVIHYTPINAQQQKFLKGLQNIFKASDSSIQSITESIVKWRKTIPESTKISETLSQECRKALIQIDSSKEPYKLLFNQLPLALSRPAILDNTQLKQIKLTLIQLEEAKKQIDKTYTKLLLNIKNNLLDLIDCICLEYLAMPIKSLKKENTIVYCQNTLTKIKTYSFSKSTNQFMGRVLNFDSTKPIQYFLETTGEVLTGFSPRYWDKKCYDSFLYSLKGLKNEIELACEVANPNFKGQSVLAYIDKGTNKKAFIKLGVKSKTDKKLNNMIKEITLILNSVDEIDKKKVIINIIEHLL